jgi:glycosyltransferase involved in cell wall biosynthesis
MRMSEKRILLVGNGNHQFITNYVHWLKKSTKSNFIVDILSYTKVKDENKKYYNTVFRKNDRNLIYQIISKIKGVRRYYRFFLYIKIIKTLPLYDVVHFHFISIDSYFIIEHFKKNTTSKIILSIWGSDMYRVNSTSEKGFIEACQKADALTFTNQKSIDYFKIKYYWNKNNLKLCRFGLTPLENLKKLTTTRLECKKQLNWNPKKRAVTIGYNLNTAQQHLEILTQFDNDSTKELMDEIQLILPITYGGTPKYKNQLLEKLKKLPFEHTVYDTFLSDEQVAQIRHASDIMIQLQVTDQFSGSMQEHLFARNVVITGSWLPYETMKENGAWFIEIDKLEELAKVIPVIIKDFEKYELKTKNNPQVISELSSWDKNIYSWIDLYNS